MEGVHWYPPYSTVTKPPFLGPPNAFVVSGLGGQGGPKRPHSGPHDRGLGGPRAGVSCSAGLK